MSTKLLHGCSYTDLWVTPENWKKNNDLSLDWKVECKFYDPEFKQKYPDGFRFRRRVNKFKTIQERREAILLLLEEIPKTFEQEGYNPISKSFMKKLFDASLNDINPEMKIIDAFQVSRSLIPGSEKHLNQVRIAVNRLEKQIRHLKLSHLSIGELNYATFYNIINSLNLKNSYFNKFRMYFMSIFKVLIKNQCVKENYAAMIDKRVEVKSIRKTLTIEQIWSIMGFLEENYYEFFRYSKIFFYSGTRSAELLSIQRKNVRLDKQEYDVLIKKRANSYSWETKVILKDALPFWEELISLSKNKEDYIFSKNLSPGVLEIKPAQITRRWSKHVKGKLTFYNEELCKIEDLKKQGIKKYDPIEEDFYSLKHSFLDYLDEKQTNSEVSSNSVLELVNSLDLDAKTKQKLLQQLSGPSFDIAQNMAAHRSSSITDKVYKVNKKKRENEYLKGLRL
ncbi:Phage integrase family [Algoriella xinjiangensis]|uniref:hypothetical protein n=1 Tax=Algoriella xinjiangensis TaxID=684065 RepID=UPI000F639654|nr:hypothetical protein [Algoriella xinjiangensis]VDH16693.1 Phage integrase family [Algoriella xinjiangensis]